MACDHWEGRDGHAAAADLIGVDGLLGDLNLNLLGIALALLVFPRTVQRIAIRSLTEGPTSHIQIIKTFVSSHS